MNQFKNLFKKLLSFLRVRSSAGGLEISDQVIRLVYFTGKTWEMAAIRLAPGIMEKGKVKNPTALTAALYELKLKLPGIKDKNKKLNVVVSLSSANIYSQTFSLPAMEGDELTKAIELNVQMVSPSDIAQVHSGWEILDRDEANLRIEVLAAFIDKVIVDEVAQILFQAGFITVGIESRALALVRILREKSAGVDPARSYLLVNVDNSGIDFLVVRKGRLHFEYSNQWADLADEKGSIPPKKFSDTLSASVRQVANFYSQHWGGQPLAAIILSAAAFGDQAEKAIAEAISLPVVRLTLVMGQPISSEWLVALGSSLRGIKSTLNDTEVNLSGEGAADLFRKEQFLHFLSLWRVLVPVVLALLVVIYASADNFLIFTKKSIESQPGFNQQSGQQVQITQLEASSTAFNDSVALVQAAESQQTPKYPIVAEIKTLAVKEGVAIEKIQFDGVTTVTLIGTGQSEDSILALSNDIKSDSFFGVVNLPPSAMQLNNGIYAFTMTFPINSAALKSSL
jgi:hypothetical protein